LIEGRTGADTLDGGSGTDILTYSSSSAGVTVNLAIGSGSGGDAAGDVFYNFENIIGSSYSDILTGDLNANNILGGDGDDTLEGKGGADTLDGASGNDTVSY
jgi:Ca2+-binding RTX toxin-like protein